MFRRTVLTAFFLVVACGSEKGGEGKQKSSSGEQGAKSADLSTLVTGKTVTLPAEVSKAAFGSPEADVLKATGADSTYLSSKTHDGVSYDFDFTREEKKLEKITMASQTELEPVLTKQWGPPIKNKKGEAFWFDPASGMRAWLPDFAKGKRVAFSKYDPVETLLGAKGFELAFAAGKPLIGATIDELKTAWGGKLCDFDREGANVKASIEAYRKESLGQWHDKKKQLRLCLPLARTVDQGTPYGDTVTFGRMGKVEEILLSFQTSAAPEIQKQLVDFLDAKFGKATELTTSSGGKERWYFDSASKRRAIAMINEESVALSFGRYQPVAEILAADAPGVISLATKSMPGGTPAQIEKEDPEHFNPHGELPELVFPATDWVRQETDVSIDSYDKAPSSYAYTVVLHHANNEAAGDEVFAILEKKLGPAKKDSKWTDKDQYFNFKTKDGKKIETRRSSQQWWIRVNK